MGPGDIELAAQRLRLLLDAADDVGRLRAVAKALAQAARNAAMTDKTPDYGYSRDDRDRDARGYLPAGGSRWSTPREILGDTLKGLANLQPPIPAGPHVRSLTNEQLAVELDERSRTVDGALCSGPGMMFADRAIFAEAARRLRISERARCALLEGAGVVDHEQGEAG